MFDLKTILIIVTTYIKITCYVSKAIYTLLAHSPYGFAVMSDLLPQVQRISDFSSVKFLCLFEQFQDDHSLNSLLKIKKLRGGHIERQLGEPQQFFAVHYPEKASACNASEE